MLAKLNMNSIYVPSHSLSEIFILLISFNFNYLQMVLDCILVFSMIIAWDTRDFFHPYILLKNLEPFCLDSEYNSTSGRVPARQKVAKGST